MVTTYLGAGGTLDEAAHVACLGGTAEITPAGTMHLMASATTAAP